jgi:hypothetical protein
LKNMSGFRARLEHFVTQKRGHFAMNYVSVTRFFRSTTEGLAMPIPNQMTEIEPGRCRQMDSLAGSSDFERTAKLLVEFVKGRGSYLTRVWTALFTPLAAGVFLGWSIERQFENLILGTSIVAIYSLALWVQKRYLG